MTCPLAAHGVSTSRRSTCAAGMRASICDRVSRVRATRPSSRRNAALPSMAGPTSGIDEAAPAVAAEGVRRQRRRAHEVVGRRADPGDGRAVEAADLLGDPGRGDGQGDPRLGHLGGDEVEEDEQRPLVAQHRAGLVDEPDALAHRVVADAEVGAGGARPAPPSLRRPGSSGGRGLGGVAIVEAAVDDEHLDPDPAQQAGQHQRRHPAGAVDHDLEPGLLDPAQVDGAHQVLHVGLDGPRREGQVADLAGERAPELLALEHAFELALGGLRTGRCPASRGRRCRRSRARRGSSGSSARPRHRPGRPRAGSPTAARPRGRARRSRWR